MHTPANTGGGASAISKRAQQALEFVRRGRFYGPYDAKKPAAIAELEAADLIVPCGRAVTLVSAYVPADGYVPMRMEAFKGEHGYAAALVEQAAPELLAALEDSALAIAYLMRQLKIVDSGWTAVDGRMISLSSIETANAIAIAKAKGGAA